MKELLPAAEKLMTLLNSYTNELGMLNNPPYSYWLDHTLNDRRGANLTLNGHYLGALEDYSKVLEWLNKTEKSTILKEKAEKFKNIIGAILGHRKNNCLQMLSSMENVLHSLVNTQMQWL